MKQELGKYKKAGSIHHQQNHTPKNNQAHILSIAMMLMVISATLTLFSLMLGARWGALMISLILSFSVFIYLKSYVELSEIKLSKFAFLASPLLVLFVAFYFWNTGTPYGEREYDESGQFYIQRYSTMGPSFFSVAMPGQGSDNIDGFIRLYDADGNLLNEYFTTYLVAVEPTWLGNSVWLMGTSDEVCWQLIK